MSLKTGVQMVAARHGVTLVPEMALVAEVPPDGLLSAVRFADPEPHRTIGLVWRASSPRRKRYERLGRLITEAWRTSEDERRAAP